MLLKVTKTGKVELEDLNHHIKNLNSIKHVYVLASKLADIVNNESIAKLLYNKYAGEGGLYLLISESFDKDGSYLNINENILDDQDIKELSVRNTLTENELDDVFSVRVIKNS